MLDAISSRQLWDSTAVIVCTDHGHYLGEHDIFGKPGAPVYEPLGHIPLMISWPGIEPSEVSALTTTVDIFATLCDVFDVNVEQRTHGVSLVPLIEGGSTSIREYVLTGVWGRSVQLLTGDEKLVRSPRHGNRPLSMWSNRWSTMPIHAYPDIRLPRPDERAALDYMPGSNVPVIRQPFEEGDAAPYWAQSAISSTGEDLVFNVVNDPSEQEDRSHSAAHERLSELLRDALTEIDAPSDQFTRLGL